MWWWSVVFFFFFSGRGGNRSGQRDGGSAVCFPISYDVKQLEPEFRSPSEACGSVRKWRLIWAAELPVNTLFCAFCSFRCEPCNRRFSSTRDTLDRHAARGVRAIRWNRSSGSVRRPKPHQEAAAYMGHRFARQHPFLRLLQLPV